MRATVFLLACGIALASAQYQEADGPQKTALRSARFQRLPSARPVAPTQSAYPSQRIRRPVSFRPRGSVQDEQPGPPVVSYPSAKPRPLPTASAPAYTPEVRPVNEEPEEDDRAREEDDRSRSQETSETAEDESDENLARAVANLGAVGSTGFTRSGPGAASPQGQGQSPFRPGYQGGPPSGRPATGPGSSGTAPGQFRGQQPQQKPTKPRKQFAEETFRQQQQQPQPQQHQQHAKPVKPQSLGGRAKKPVAQVIKRYREDNPDGSITWGFENDDGSYKEELIGIDCITRGKYGYIDPDGIRREYTYETGIRCDEEQRNADEENENSGGFVDYQENKLVLPSGKTIDLSTMGKKQARRPGPVYSQ